MATVADYQVLSDDGFILDAATNDHERTFNFSFPTNFVFGTSRAKSILAFKILPFEETKLDILINFRKIFSATFAQSVSIGFWEAFSSSETFPNGSSIPNQVPVRLITQSGRARFNDIVLWYQVKLS